MQTGPNDVRNPSTQHSAMYSHRYVVGTVLARFCPPGRKRAAEILSARAAEIPFSPSFSPMGRNCLVVHIYRIVALSVDGVLSSLCYKLSVG